VSERRVTDRERERTVELLREHTVMGSLPHDDLEERSRAALSARTEGELAAVTRDLPGLPEPPRTTRLAERFPLRVHVALYVVANVAFVILWLLTRDTEGPAERTIGRVWPLWVAALWGFALSGHALLSMRKPAVRRADRRRERAR
jgi:hypothetical protein